MNVAAGEGGAFLPGIEFSNGTIEFDVRGKDVAQRSFVGVAFHGVDAGLWVGNNSGGDFANFTITHATG